MASEEPSGVDTRQCVNCGTTLHSDEPGKYKKHIPPIPDEYVTQGDDVETAEDVIDAFDLAFSYAFGEGAAIHIGAGQRKVDSLDDVLPDEWNRECLHKIRPFSPYDADHCASDEEVPLDG